MPNKNNKNNRPKRQNASTNAARLNVRTTNLLARVENKLAGSKPNNKRGKARPKRGSQQSSLDNKHPAAQKLVIAAASPFHEKAKGVYLANEHAKPSLKSSALSRGTLSGKAGDLFVFAMCPNLSNTGASLIVCKIDASEMGVQGIDDGNIAQATGQPSAFPKSSAIQVFVPHMYSTEEIKTDSTLGVRGAAAGLRIKYTGHNLHKGGTWSYLKCSDYQPLLGTNATAVSPTGTLTWDSLVGIIDSNRLTRVNVLNTNSVVEYSMLARPDAHFQTVNNQTSYPLMADPNYVDDYAYLMGFYVGGGVYSIAYYKVTDAQQTFSYDLVVHMEQKSDKLYQVHSPSPAHVQDHAAVHQSIDRAHESHNDQAEKPLLHHILDTVASEATTVVTQAGRSLFSSLMSEVRKPSNYTTMGMAALSLL